MKNDLNIVYMGTPEFAVPPLRSMAESGYRISLVVLSLIKHVTAAKK